MAANAAAFIKALGLAKVDVVDDSVPWYVAVVRSEFVQLVLRIYIKRLDDLQRAALACAKYSREYISEQATARSSERHVG
jgi:hypothetical protein